jgi:hemerythrin-like domain-containing protein
VKIIDDLDKEHRLFEDVAGSLVTLVSQWVKNDSEEIRKDLKNLIIFLRDFMVSYHTKKEENLVFSALEKMGIPRHKGPLYFYDLEHKLHLDRVNQFLDFLDEKNLTENLKGIIYKTAIDYCKEIWEHIDKEDSVLFQEVSERIRGVHLQNLDAEFDKYIIDHRPDENLVLNAKHIIEKYEPVKVIPDVFRGDGCMSCRFFGEGCDGIEHEWWTEHEWEDFFERNNRD